MGYRSGYTSIMPRVLEHDKTVRVAEYLEFEETATNKHEFVGGQIFAMAGASKAHNRIALNLATRALNAADELNCEVYSSDVKVQIEKIYYYPDLIVSCKKDKDKYFARRPCAIIEVLSSGTADIDRGEKWQNYQKLKSLQTYILLDQTRISAEVFQRLPDGAWRYEKLEERNKLKIPCLNLELLLSDAYKGVELPEPNSGSSA
jgi:Uma2 family endonuclease